MPDFSSVPPDLDVLFSDPSVLAFCEQYRDAEVSQLALRFREKFPPRVFTQIALRQKARQKLPSWVNAGCLFLPKLYEQSTAEAVAKFKATLWSEAQSFADCTLGLGVDAAFRILHTQPKKIWLCEMDPEHAEIFTFNAKRLGLPDFHLKKAAAEDCLDQILDFDLVYLDPDRRVDNQRSWHPADWSPNLEKMLPTLLANNRKVVVKFSPMTDLAWIERQWSTCSSLYVIALHNEVKEILAEFTYGFSGQTARVAVHLDPKPTLFPFSEGRIPSAKSDMPTKVLLEPGVAILKAGLTDAFFRALSLSPLTVGSPYALASHPFSEFAGRQFEILEEGPFKPDVLRKRWKNEGIQRMEVASRNYYENVDSIRKKLKLPPGGDRQLIVTLNSGNQAWYFLCKRLPK